MQSIAESNTEVKFDEDGWPINPATGEAYEPNDLVADPSLPLPKDRLAQNFLQRKRDRAAGKVKSKPKRRSRSRRSGKRTLRTSAPLIPLSFAEKETRKRARSTGDLVKRSNDTEARSILITSGSHLRILEVVS